MHSGFKEEPPLEICFQDVGELPSAGPSRYRKRRLSAGKSSGLRLPEVTESSIDAMNRLLQHWGLEALSGRFAEHMIDLNVLDYILDVDIVDLCRDMPIRYRLVLRHNLQNGYHKNIFLGDQPDKQPHTIITFSKDPNALSSNSPDRRKKKKKKSAADSMAHDTLGSDIEPSSFVSVETAANNNDTSGTESGKEDESIRSILQKEPKFRSILNTLDKGLVPDPTGLRHMNRLLVNHFFEERILEEASYPKKQEKHELALKILEAYPHLEQTRVTPDAPKESYFFWFCGGKEKGPHTGLIETRCANMRKEVPPEQRRYQRKDKGAVVNYILPDSVREHATAIAAMSPLHENEEAISSGMNECIDLHSCILQQTDSDQTEALISTFPHLLSYQGKMVQQVFQRLHTFYETTARSDKFLLLGLLLGTKAFNNVENKYIRATLRIMKKLAGKKDEPGVTSSDEAEASPLIRWIKPLEDESEADAVQRHVSKLSYLAPHIVCVADVFSEGNMFVVFQGRYIDCGQSAAHTLDVFFKLFAVFGITVPVLLRRVHELLTVYLWKVTNICKSAAVTKLVTKLKELEMANDDDDYEDLDDLS
ncbi:uncharacterized protein LOC115257758 [Aedes albopictus]|uniref:SAM domain-containing protein n=1 Tax=Aedes albopictus TaxID=7160 RepID=A0ABM1XMF1_AEDAL|nr:uncharacterized protein LOC115257758 [Aedes albopictus]